MDDLQEVRRLADEPRLSPEKEQQLRDRVTGGIRERASNRQRRFVSPKLWVPGVAAVLTGAVVAGVVLFTNITGSPQPAEPGPTVLQEIADSLEAQGSPQVEVPASDQWVYLNLASEDADLGDMSEETWTRADNSQRGRMEPDGTLNITDGEGLGIGKPIQGASDDPAQAYEFLANLPHDDPAAVLEQIYTRNRPESCGGLVSWFRSW